MIKTFKTEHEHYGKSRLLYFPRRTGEKKTIDLQAFRLQRIEQLNESINEQGEVHTVILHPLLEQSIQSVFTNFMSAILFAWAQNLPVNYLTTASKTKLLSLLETQALAEANWSFFSRQQYYPDWDDTAIARKCFPDRTFDHRLLVENYLRGHFAETWMFEAPDHFLVGDIDLCVNLNVLDYLLSRRAILLLPPQIQAWCQRILETNGASYFSIYYQSVPFLAYQMAKIFHYYPVHREQCPSLFLALKKYLASTQLVHNNFLSFIFIRNARAYCEQVVSVSADIDFMYSALQSASYYTPAPFFYGPEGWYGASAISNFLVLEYLSLTTNATA